MTCIAVLLGLKVVQINMLQVSKEKVMNKCSVPPDCNIMKNNGPVILSTYRAH